MKPTYHNAASRVDYLLKKFRGVEFDDYTRAHIANYACVLLSGLIENAIRDIISNHSERNATPRISNFIKSRLEGFRNPDPESVSKLLASFDIALAERLEAHWSGEVKDAIGSIVGNRHLIAHGRNTTLTLVRVTDWFRAAQNFIGFLEAEFA
jgi:RiboL-PSP-HEPN